MPGITYEEFEQHYLRIIAQIALKAVQKGDIDIIEEFDPITLDFRAKKEDDYQEEIEELRLLKEQAEKAEFKDELGDFNFSLNNRLLDHDVDDAVFRFFAQDIFDVDKVAPYEGEEQTRLDELDDIPESVRDEIKAMAYVAVFEELRKNADNEKGFLHFAGILEKMSDGIKSSKIDNPKINAEVTRASGILKNIENANSNLTRERAQSLMRGNSKSIIFERAERAYDLQQELKTELAKYLAENSVNLFDHKGDLKEDINLPNFIKRVDTEGIGVKGFLPKQFENIKGQQGLVSTKDFLTALGVDKNNVDDFRKQVKSEKDIFSRKIKDRNESLRRNKLQSANAKEQLGIRILKISGVSEGQINRIMQNPDARKAITKRAENAFENLRIDLEEMNIIGIDEALKDVDSKVLQGEIEKQSKEFIAQVGRISSRSLDSKDMRGNEHLHDEYQAKANKMDSAEFDKNAEKALEYEKTKDERGRDTIARKSLQLLGALRPKDEKFWTPGKTAIAGLVALAVLAPPLGAIVCVALMCKAAKNQFYDESKLQNWVNDKLFEKPPEKFDSQELEQVTVKGLSQDVKAQYSEVNKEPQQGAAQELVQEQQRGGELGRGEEVRSTQKESQEKESDGQGLVTDFLENPSRVGFIMMAAEGAYEAASAIKGMFFKKGSETPDRQEPQQGATQGLVQEQQWGGELGREASRAAAPDDRGQSMQEVRDQARELGGSMRDQGISSPDRSLGSVGEAYVGAEAARRTHTASSSSRSR